MELLRKDFLDEFLIGKNKIYLDNAAMSPLPKKVKNAIDSFHNSRMTLGPNFPKWWDKVEDTRQKIAKKINTSADEIAFLSNTSMGINLAAQAIPFNKGDNVIITDLEFPSNVYPWMNLKSIGVEVRFAKNKNGKIELEDIENLVDKKTKAISVSWVMATNGFKIDIEKLGAFCKEMNIIFVVDAIQGLGVFPLDAKKIHADFIISGFYKWMLGPDGISFIYINEEILDELKIPYIGWASMEERFNYTNYKFRPVKKACRYETGNMNFSAIYGVAEGIDFTSGLEDEITKRVVELNDYLRRGLKKISGINISSNFNKKNQSAITLINTSDDLQLFNYLKKHSVIVNHRDGIRISPNFFNTKDEIDQLLNFIEARNKTLNV